MDTLNNRIDGENQNEKRRNFLSKIISFLTIILLGSKTTLLSIPMFTSFIKKKKKQWIEVGQIRQFQPGEPKNVMVSVEGKEGWYHHVTKKLVLVVKHDERSDNIVVFSSTCPHLGCTVQWDEKKSCFLCPCHGGSFDIDGNVLTGPPPGPLTRYKVNVEQGKLFVLES